MPAPRQIDTARAKTALMPYAARIQADSNSIPGNPERARQLLKDGMRRRIFQMAHNGRLETNQER
jgi:hypothetical protein